MEKKACSTMSYGTSWPIKLRDNNGETNEGNEAGVNQAAICLWHGRCPHPPPPTVTTSCVTSPPPPTPIPYPHLPPRHYQHALSPCHRHPRGLTTAVPLPRPPFSALSTATVYQYNISHLPDTDLPYSLLRLYNIHLFRLYFLGLKHLTC